MSPCRAILFLSMMIGLQGAAAARADAPVFLRSFDVSKHHAMAFPKAFPLFDMKDRPATIAFGNDQPWRLVNFWAAWCGPCIREMPSLKALQDKTRGSRSFQVMLVSSDMLPSAEALRYMMNQKNLPRLDDALYIKDYAAWESLGIEGLPTTMIVSPQGKIVSAMTGAGDWQSGDAMAFLHKTLPPHTLP